MRNQAVLQKIGRRVKLFLVFCVLAFLISAADIAAGNPLDFIGNLVRWNEFDFVSWELNALFERASAAALKLEKFIPDEKQSEIVLSYLDQVGVVESLQEELEILSFDPAAAASFQAQAEIYRKYQEETERMHRMGRLAESILQNQAERSLLKMGFGLGGQVLPPLLFKVTDLPLNLIISPREEIRTLKSISLKSGMDPLEKDALETNIYQNLSLSALVEPVGGIGAYPTMVMRSRDINWLTEIISHEWIHNYLTFYPLGIRYFENNQIRTINETTANLSGKEVGQRILIDYYPAYVRFDYLQGRDPSTVLPGIQEEKFDYRAQMRETRVTVDYLLSKGYIDQAEAYMEARREFFWENGYRLRKINQAYFAFYGSYNDTPGGGAAGNDPVGPAVQELRKRSQGLKVFIDQIKSVKSFDELLIQLR
ncbi:MAG TPA: hypothetical protein GX730_02065 [Chloroflexi bacterium]|nr:hypothetical protein [Chloroflexota bacterium]